ncbi:glycosyltransferase [Streptomyces sp. B21-083]|uniref:glycosyltransferase n=1 Tax=Streptomyces sp. B21-083 TaxID=3039410 RepID=UPI002FF42EB0
MRRQRRRPACRGRSAGPLPPNVRAVDVVPLNELLPSCAAIIHHGVAGTLRTVMAQGVPQVIVPARMWCNTPSAEQARAAGVALACPPEWLTAGQSRATVTRVLPAAFTSPELWEVERERVFGQRRWTSQRAVRARDPRRFPLPPSPVCGFSDVGHR